MIDTSDLVDELNMWVEHGTKPSITTEKIRILLDEIKRLTQEPEEERRWIPVIDRLPEPYVLVLVITAEDVYGVMQLSEDECGEYTWIDNESTIHKTVDISHWRPLPELPKERTEVTKLAVIQLT